MSYCPAHGIFLPCWECAKVKPPVAPPPASPEPRKPRIGAGELQERARHDYYADEPPASPEYFRTIDPPLVPMTSASPEPPEGWFADEEWPGKPSSPEPMPEGWELSRVMTGESTHVGWQFKHHRSRSVFALSLKTFADLLATQGLRIVDEASAAEWQEFQKGRAK